MTDIFLQLAVIISIAVLVSFIMKWLRQPLIIGYILTGIIVGPSLFSVVGEHSSLEVFASIGVALLLFIVGLGLNPSMVKDVGKISVVTGAAQVVFTSVFGVLIGQVLGFTIMTSLYLAVAFTFSSTIIILRLLYDKEDQDSLYGRVAIGFLLVQDLIAMFIFVFLSAFNGEMVAGGLLGTVGWVLLKLSLVGLVLYLLWKFVIPQVDRFVSSNTQMLFIFSLALCFSMASLFQLFGFSLELGALIAGVLLSSSPHHREMASRIQPLRDFFLVIFFIFLGTNMVFASVLENIVPIVIFSAFILIGNPLIVLFLMTKLGHTRRTAFFAGLTVAQISEFSLIMLGIGIDVGHIPREVLALGTSVGLLTIAASSYMITYNEQLYQFLAPFLRFLTPYAKDHEVAGEVVAHAPELIIIGGHRTGGGIISALKKKNDHDYLVIDHDPGLVERLREDDVPVLFGDAYDAAFLDDIDISRTKLIVSTLHNVEINSFLLQYFSKEAPGAHVICLANHRHQAQRLYDEGAAYVIMPFYLGRRFIAELFEKNLFNARKYKTDRKRHLLELKHLKHSP